MFPYTVKYTESESDIQNNDLSYNILQQYQHTFEALEHLVKSEKTNAVCISYIIHIL